MITITTIEELRKLTLEADGTLYVRWSLGYKADRKLGYSHDYLSGQDHAGLSAIQIERAWAEDTDGYLLDRYMEYAIKALSGDTCNIYRGRVVNTDSDGYDGIEIVEQIAIVSEELLGKARQIKYAEYMRKYSGNIDALRHELIRGRRVWVRDHHILADVYAALNS